MSKTLKKRAVGASAYMNHRESQLREKSTSSLRNVDLADYGKIKWMEHM